MIMGFWRHDGNFGRVNEAVFTASIRRKKAAKKMRLAPEHVPSASFVNPLALVK
jgi:hypothetical protein